jgi:hypothetical protein
LEALHAQDNDIAALDPMHSLPSLCTLNLSFNRWPQGKRVTCGIARAAIGLPSTIDKVYILNAVCELDFGNHPPALQSCGSVCFHCSLSYPKPTTSKTALIPAMTLWKGLTPTLTLTLAVSLKGWATAAWSPWRRSPPCDRCR